MANRLFQQFQGTLEKGVVKLYGTFTIGAAGAVSTSACKGFSVAKTAAKTGRYTITLQDKYNQFLIGNITLEGPADAAYGSGGAVGFFRGSDVGGTTPLTYVQIASAAASPADTDAPSGTRVYVELVLKNSTAF